MSIGQELEELKNQLKELLQYQNTIVQELQNLHVKINKIEATLEMVSPFLLIKFVQGFQSIKSYGRSIY